ncbi:hypothetical protein D3C84_660400 [compost metagenome]
MEANAGEGGGDSFFKVQITQFDRRRHLAERQVGVETVVNLTQLQAAGDVTFEAQFATRGGNVQQLAADGRLEFFTVQIDVNQLCQFQRRAEGIAALVINHFIGQAAAVATRTTGFIDGQRAVAFPRNAYTVVEAFDLVRFAGQQVPLAITGDHFVQGHHVAFAVEVHQVALETLASFVERDNQRVMTFLQLAQVAGDFQGCAEHLGWLRSIFRV